MTAAYVVHGPHKLSVERWYSCMLEAAMWAYSGRGYFGRNSLTLVLTAAPYLDGLRTGAEAASSRCPLQRQIPVPHTLVPILRSRRQ
jgi:hypothetical protein